MRNWANIETVAISARRGLFPNYSGRGVVVKVFKCLRVPQVRDSRVSTADLPESYRSRIAMIGCGPASISCASFLARLGYSDITIFEKRQYAGGLRYIHIPR